MKYFTLRSFLLFLISLLNPERLVEGRSLKHPWINNFSLNSLSFVGDEGTFVPLPGNPSELKEITIKPKSLKLSREIRSLSQKAGQVSDENRRSEAVLVRMQALLPILHYLAGPVIQIRQFINWDKTIIISTVFYARPKNIWEVQDILRAATHVGLQARATGVGHTRSPLYVDEGNIMIDVKGLERHDGPRIEIHRPKPFKDYYILTGITGIIEEELNEYMKKNGVTMLAQPLNVKETLGGMAAVATHGSSWNEPTVSGYVVANPTPQSSDSNPASRDSDSVSSDCDSARNRLRLCKQRLHNQATTVCSNSDSVNKRLRLRNKATSNPQPSETDSATKRLQLSKQRHRHRLRKQAIPTPNKRLQLRKTSYSDSASSNSDSASMQLTQHTTVTPIHHTCIRLNQRLYPVTSVIQPILQHLCTTCQQ
ncbi:unnamed protein product [Acanthosepion pharaonis]|uniref:FAD linked oxidase N-terminal domain-containing protein n=1 Tax=Acanthosepion pharaonis TaxID=158019 RepID=A0A812CM67_ACAPH|nr:unnamed protein product [Sepia pharaonis]